MRTNAAGLLTVPTEALSSKAVRRILIVDDDADHRLLLSDFLESNGYSPLTAENGPEALTKLSTHPVSLVLTDLMMPGMNGLELIRHMVHRKWLDHTPVILLSGTSRENLEQVAKHAGAFATLLKPYDMKRLLDLISSAIGQSDSTAAGNR